MSEPTSTRLNSDYRDALSVLRGAVLDLTEDTVREIILEHIDGLADLLVRGVEPLVQMPLSEAQAESDAEHLSAKESAA